MINDDLINKGKNILDKKGGANCYQESIILYKYLYKYKKNLINKDLKNKDKEQEFQNIYLAMVLRRAQGIPLAYLIYEWSFYDIDLHILNKVLIPRSDTEVLIDLILHKHNQDSEYRILDIGVGSGAILTKLLHYFYNSYGLGVDISLEAIRNTYINLYKYNLQADLQCIDFQNMSCDDLSNYDIIVSNPPYIDINEKKYMNSETKYEPDIALYSINYHIYHAIFNKLKYIYIDGNKILKNTLNNKIHKRKMLYLEISMFNCNYLYKLFNQYWVVEITNDLNNNPRVLTIYLI